ncbi:MAG: DUF1616 domain-containing protein [Chloroflexi bacterium]|nr:DUF1616 domain-containing protein [Chloroflexota bacterium]
MFYVLGSEGKLENYPTDLTVGQEAGVTLSVENHERQAMNYRIEVKLQENEVWRMAPIELASEEKWTQQIKFTPAQAGAPQRLGFLLFRQEITRPTETRISTSKSSRDESRLDHIDSRSR